MSSNQPRLFCGDPAQHWCSVPWGIFMEQHQRGCEISQLGASETSMPSADPLPPSVELRSDPTTPLLGQVSMLLYGSSWHQGKQKMGLLPGKLMAYFNISLAGSSADQVSCLRTLSPHPSLCPCLAWCSARGGALAEVSGVPVIGGRMGDQ